MSQGWTVYQDEWQVLGCKTGRRDCYKCLSCLKGKGWTCNYGMKMSFTYIRVWMHKANVFFVSNTCFLGTHWLIVTIWLTVPGFFKMLFCSLFIIYKVQIWNELPTAIFPSNCQETGANFWNIANKEKIRQNRHVSINLCGATKEDLSEVSCTIYITHCCDS